MINARRDCHRGQLNKRATTLPVWPWLSSRSNPGLTDLRCHLPLLAPDNAMLFCRCPTVGAEFMGLPEAPSYAAIGTLYGPGLSTIGAVIRDTANGDSAAGALIPFCHFPSFFYARLSSNPICHSDPEPFVFVILERALRFPCHSERSEESHRSG